MSNADPKPPAESRFWDDIAEKYAAKPVADPAAYQRKLTVTKARLHADDDLLDIGCGTGSLAFELAPLVAKVDAIDISTQMIRIAKAKAKAATIENVSFHSTTIAAANTFRDAAFNVVSAYNILHLVPDLDATLAKIYAWLKNGGLLVSSTACLGEDWMPYRLILPVMRLLGKAPPVSILHVAQLQSAMKRAGFVALERVKVNDAKNTAFLLARKP